MPCWTVQKNTLALKGLNPEILRATLTAMGYGINSEEYSRRFAAQLTADRFSDRTSVLVTASGELQVTAGDSATNLAAVTSELKRTYAAETVKAAAKRFGWTMKQTAPNKYAVQRRF